MPPENKKTKRKSKKLVHGATKAARFAVGRADLNSHVLRTPTEVRRTLVYVRDNAKKHYGRFGRDYSSAAYPALTLLPETWLLSSQRAVWGTAPA